MDTYRFYDSNDEDDTECVFECQARTLDDAVCLFGDSIAGQTDHFEVWVERDGDGRTRVRGLIETITRTTWRNA